MADSNGYQVAPADLNTFADYLNNTTVNEINTAAQGVTSANGFDVDAFGVVLGQTMGVPSRIAMGVVADQLKALSQKIAGVATNTRTTATTYSQNDSNVATSFQNIQGG
jgi:DUF2075 family protein